MTDLPEMFTVLSDYTAANTAATSNITDRGWYERMQSGTYSTVRTLSEYNGDEIEQIKGILLDLCDLLAMMYDRDGPRAADGLCGIRAFIDSIKVIEEGGCE